MNRKTIAVTGWILAAAIPAAAIPAAAHPQEAQRGQAIASSDVLSQISMFNYARP